LTRYPQVLQNILPAGVTSAEEMDSRAGWPSGGPGAARRADAISTSRGTEAHLSVALFNWLCSTQCLKVGAPLIRDLPNALAGEGYIASLEYAAFDFAPFQICSIEDCKSRVISADDALPSGREASIFRMSKSQLSWAPSETLTLAQLSTAL
jgi:hypothetical protein